MTSRRIKLKKAAATAAVAVPAAMGALFVSAEVASAAPAAGTYVVQPGDTLSQIAASHGTSWTALASANHLANPNLIFPGQVLDIGSSSSVSLTSSESSTDAEAPAEYLLGTVPPTSTPPAVETTPAPVHTYSAPSVSTVTAAPVTHTYTPPVPPTYTPPVQPTYTAPVSQPTASSTSASPNSSFQACVIKKESSGNPNVMNSSGHYGLYQFDMSTWTSGGGSASSFGHASVAQQNAVFNNVYAARGTSPWASYDGC